MQRNSCDAMLAFTSLEVYSEVMVPSNERRGGNSLRWTIVAIDRITQPSASAAVEDIVRNTTLTITN